MKIYQATGILTLYWSHGELRSTLEAWTQTDPCPAFQGVPTETRATPATKLFPGVLDYFGREDERWDKAPFDVYIGEQFEIVSRRYAS